MDALLTCLHLAAYVAVAMALALPRLRLPAALVLATAALAGVLWGITTDGARRLVTVHTFAGYEGSAMEVSMVPFPTGAFTAPGWQWPLPFLGFAAVWIAALLALRERTPRNALVLPLLLAWTAMLSWLGMQWLAAPAALVQPVGLDRFLWPAGLAVALLAAWSARSLLSLFVQVGAGVTLARLPAALFSKYSSDAHLGGVLDISSVREIVNPMTQMQFDPPLAAGSGQQQFWLIWLEHVIFFPAVHAMSLFGIAFATWMFHHHGDDPK